MLYETGFPAVSIYNPTEGNFQNPTTLDGTYNNETIFNYTFVVQSGVGDNNTSHVEAIPCGQAIDLYINDEYIRELTKDNFGGQLEYYLCPNTSSYSLFDPNWLDFHKAEYDTLTFVVALQDDVEEDTSLA